MNWDSLHELVALRDRATRRQPTADSAWTPSVDLLDTAAAFFIVVELPGIDAADFSINAAGNKVVIAGGRQPVDPPPLRYLRMERGYGRFSRVFSFDEPVNTGAITASFDRGLLTVTIPKGLATADRRITID
jgi:HSP20 family protein